MVSRLFAIYRVLTKVLTLKKPELFGLGFFDFHAPTQIPNAWNALRLMASVSR